MAYKKAASPSAKNKLTIENTQVTRTFKYCEHP